MQEKSVSMEDAFQVWWFIGWRTALTMIGFNIVAALVLPTLGADNALGPIIQMITLIASVLISVYYVNVLYTYFLDKFV